MDLLSTRNYCLLFKRSIFEFVYQHQACSRGGAKGALSFLKPAKGPGPKIMCFNDEHGPNFSNLTHSLVRILLFPRSLGPNYV